MGKIVNVSEDDAGEYKFEAKGSFTSCELGMKYEEVYITKQLDAQIDSEELDTIILRTEVEIENASCRWLHNNKEIIHGGVYDIYMDGKKHVLKIKDILLDHAGMYTFDTGDDETSTKINVSPLNLSLVRSLEDVKVNEYDNAILELELHKASAAINVRWFLGSDELFNSPTCRLSTKGATHILCIQDCVEGGAVQAVCAG